MVADEIVDCEGEERERDSRDPRDAESVCESLRFASASVTVLTPKPSSDDAGMNKVVRPSRRLRAVRRGWSDEQQAL